MTRLHAQGWMRRSATMPGPNRLRITGGKPGSRERRAIIAGATGGRFKCLSGRQSVRTRRRVDKSGNSWGLAADRKIHPRAERRGVDKDANASGCSPACPNGPGVFFWCALFCAHQAAGQPQTRALRTPLSGGKQGNDDARGGDKEKPARVKADRGAEVSPGR